MVLLLRDIIAVHDVRSGEVLWQQHHKMPKGSSCLFITKVFTGFLFFNKAKEPEIQVFDTSNGNIIANQTIKFWMSKYHMSMIARGSYLCYADHFNIHVIKFCCGKTTCYKYPMPRHFFKPVRKNAKGFFCWNEIVVDLLGFLGKSHVLIGTLYQYDQIDLFAFDIEAAASAHSEQEAELAFSRPLDSRKQKLNLNNGSYYDPVYRTDRINGCIDMVGVMRRRASKKLKIDAYFFETQLEFKRNDKTLKHHS